MADPTRARILFVDDEESIRRLFTTFLSSEGYEVDAVSGVAKAREMIGSRHYDLCIVDKNLPDGSGLDVLRLIRERNLEIELLILTGYPSMESAIEALRNGAYDYLIKPVLDLELVAEKVRRALERHRLRLGRTVMAERQQRWATTLGEVTQILDRAKSDKDGDPRVALADVTAKIQAVRDELLGEPIPSG